MYGLPGQENPVHKIPFLGDASVGKTSIVDVITKKCFNPNTKPNVGVATSSVDITVDNKTLQVSIWDTAGQETFRSLVPLYTRNAEIIVLVCDVSNKSSINGIHEWITTIKDDLGLSCPVVMLANKVDVAFAIEKEEIKKIADENEIQIFFTSALTGQGIEEALLDIGRLILRNSSSFKTPISSSPNLEAAQKKSGCC